MKLDELLATWEDYYSAHGYGGVGIVGETEKEWVLQGRHVDALGELPQPIIVDKGSGFARWCFLPSKADRDILDSAEKSIVFKQSR